jgi:transposase
LEEFQTLWSGLGMTATLTMISERVDDIPLWLAQLERMGLQALLDQHFPTHGNWVGLSLGWVLVIWLTHLLSQANHRLSHVEPWAEPRLHTLRRCTGPRVHPLDLSDDRLAGVLAAVRDDARWAAFEGALNPHLLRVYDLQPERVRLDSTTASGYWSVTEDGRFQFGHRQDHRPDLPQVKVLLSALDPLGLPVATDVVPGQRADAPLYVPAITRVRASMGRRGLLYVGDGQMGALETRGFIQAGGDFSLCPLSEIQLPPEILASSLAPVWAGDQALTPSYRQREGGPQELIAEGFERREPLTAQVAGATLPWTERRLVIRSRQLARAAAAARRARLAKAQAAVAALNERRRGKRRLFHVPALQEAVEAILARYQVQGLRRMSDEAQVRQRPVRRDGQRPATRRVEQDIRVAASVDEVAGEERVRRLGWRVYATNPPADQLSLAQAVLASRREYRMARDMGRLKGRPLSLTPMSLEREDHATGLIRMLSLGLRVLTRLEFVVRRRLAMERTALAGLYVSNPKRATARPTAERLREALQNLTLTIIREGRRRRYHLSPLSALPQRILALLDFPVAISMRLCPDSHKPP